MSKYEYLNKSFIYGQWTEGLSDRTYDIRNPYDNSVITQVRLATISQLQEAFKLAKEAQKSWAKTSAVQRKVIIQKAVDYLKENRDEIVSVIIRETGGTHLKAYGEHSTAIADLEDAINMADEMEKVKEVGTTVDGKVNRIYRMPIGVISSISPFNFPMNLSTRTIGPALALGNSVVHKPDIQVGLTGGSILAKAFEEAGLPAGVFNVILTDISEIGDEMIINPIPGFVSFTGSTAVGRHVGELAGKNLKRVALELGGNDPLVVLSDADVDRAVDAAIFGKFLHQGQICMIANRIIVHQTLYQDFVSKFAEKAKNLKYGDPRDPQTVIGPMINERQLERALQAVNEAKEAGVIFALEGERIGNILTPYVIVNVDNSSKLAQTELFGPIALIIKADSDEHAIELANESESGLSSSIFTGDLQSGERLALQIDSGMTHVNDQPVNCQGNIPFGGTKGSGIGRFGSPWIIEELTVYKWVSIQTKYRDFPF
ncbi:aldehyde dehydrogenase family protein [Paenibacillus sp. BC26]|uniref:aldehyde dehydrogenase family protein n=1 Tax=Paenibacillus sp. BC26 TaxID=1881032 RepID=UPI0008E91A3C|nr:aldehyde dehydrogenase family protein [Paenibacillus sp. BC26]SFS66740.1 aldehyde dehydrogenase (NAD+) [Paenibacillus sp. BC26]